MVITNEELETVLIVFGCTAIFVALALIFYYWYTDKKFQEMRKQIQAYEKINIILENGIENTKQIPEQDGRQ